VGLALMVTPSVAVLFVLQAALGVFRPLGWLGGQSYVSGMRDTSMRSHDTGRFGFAANLGQIVAPLAAGAVAGIFGTRTAFAVIVAFGVVFCAVGWLLPDAGRQAAASGSSGSGFGAAAGLLRLTGIQVVMLLTFCRLWIPAVWSSFFPLYLVREGSTPAVAGSVISVMAASATVTALFTGRIAKLGGPAVVTAAGLGLSCVGVGLSPVLGGLPWAYLAAVLVGFGQGLSLPMLITLTSQAAPPEVRSLALGLRSGVNQAAATLAPATVGPLIAATGIFVGFPVAAAVGGAFLAAAVLLGRERRTARL
jgi:MFS transporter, DHA1 family, inner membrane transport protein